ncbi:MAG: type II toxin-antitoxin system RelE/ParE family toxin [Candidatus Adiutrix sp.]
MKSILKTRTFNRWMKKTQLTNQALLEAIEEMIQGLVDADLGGNLYKKRIALPGRGKRGSTRTIIATNRDNRWFFLVGFEKNEKDSITAGECAYLQGVAQVLLNFSDEELDKAVTIGELLEVNND